MLRKILSLCLVAVMLSTVAFATEFVELTSVHAAEEAETETITAEKTVKASDSNSPMEFLWVTQSEADGVVSQKITTAVWTADAEKFNANRWVLAKINVGKNFVFDSMTFYTRINMAAITSTGYCIPLAKADFDAAKAIAGDESASLSNLVKPAAEITGVADGTGSATGTATKDIEFALDSTLFTSESDYYQDGYVYVAFRAENSSNNAKLALKGEASAWKFVVSGTRTLEKSTATVTTAYVDGSTTGTQSITCDISAATTKKVDHKRWLVYKFELPEQEEIAKVTFGGTFNNDSKYSGLWIYSITEAEYNAAVSDGTRTLNLEQKQNLLVCPFGNLTVYNKGMRINSSAVGSNIEKSFDLSGDLLTTVKEQGKGGYIYLAVHSAHYTNIEGTSNRETVVSNPTLTVAGVPGESTATKVNDFSDTVLMWDGSQEATEGNSFDVCTQTTSGTAKLLAVTYSGTTMEDVEVITVDAATNTTGVISGTVPALTAGDSLKIYLWEGNTLVPITDVIEF